MDQSFRSVEPLKSALFVDFDNIYIGLSKTDPAAAERFAADPARWLAWLERGLPLRNGLTSPTRERSILIRRCYPNPDAGFRRYRSFFTSAAFSVIDCPTLTRTGKNSSDIYMVMDILDTLSHKTTFDEFIIFSGDSDFMPVLLRLRAHDRRTTTLAIDFMPPAFKAACDLVINEEEFIEDALGISHESGCGGSNTGRARVPMPLLKEMAGRVYTAACDEGEVAGSSLPEILKDYREFRESNNWLGFGTSLRLAEALACSEPRLQLVRINPMLYKLVVKPQVIKPEPVSDEPVRPTASRVVKIRPVTHSEKSAPLVEKAPQAAPNSAAAANSAAHSGSSGSSGEKLSRADAARLRLRVIAIVKELVSGSPNAILLARASQHVVTQLGSLVLDTQWAGAGSFKRLLQGAGDLGLEITTQPEPGYIFDPQRHIHPAQRAQPLSAESEEGEAAVFGAEAEGQSNFNDAASLPETGNGQVEEAVEAVEAEETEIEEEVLQPEAQPYLLEELSGGYDDEDEDEDDEEEEEEDYEEPLPSLEEFARRVSQVTGAPDLTEHQYALIFHGIVDELQAIAVGDKVYNTYQSSKAVSDWCAERGETISRSDIVQIFKGIIFQDGVRFGKRPGSYTVQELATVVRNNIKALCRRSRMELSEYEEHLLDEWILGELGDEEIVSSTQSNNGSGSNGSQESSEA